jgi:hypothetical protein
MGTLIVMELTPAGYSGYTTVIRLSIIDTAILRTLASSVKHMGQTAKEMRGKGDFRHYICSVES